MKLRSLPTSPYAARVVIQCRAKGIDLEIANPEPGVERTAHAAANPFRRIPVLETPDGPLIESLAILEYLEDRYPEPPLRPEEPFAAGRVRAFVLAVDHYLFPVILELRAVPADTGPSADTLTGMAHVLDGLETWMDDSGFAIGPGFTLADCALAPAWFYLERFLGEHDLSSPCDSRPRFADWWRTVRCEPAVADTLARLEAALRKAGR